MKIFNIPVIIVISRPNIKVILINLGKIKFEVSHGDRIAQAVVSPVISGRWCKLSKSNNISSTSRGGAGFGSTATS